VKRGVAQNKPGHTRCVLDFNPPPMYREIRVEKRASHSMDK
jgi:hypothetical protein